MSRFTQSVERQWYSRPHGLWLLWPLVPVFKLISLIRKHRLQKKAYQAPLPVIIVGNISVGGTGKTPVILALAQHLLSLGITPIIVSRGYGSPLRHPRRVQPNGTAQQFGDEPLMLAQQLPCPVIVGRDRVASIQWALTQVQGQIMVCDDGLQDYALHRDLEVVVMDAERRLGNGWCLPLGPLRESAKRLQTVDTILINGPLFSADWLPTHNTYAFDLTPAYWQNIKTGQQLALNHLDLRNAQALAGIGHPQRFLNTLKILGYTGSIEIFKDHHAYTEKDLAPFKSQRLLTTEKDAVKIKPFAPEEAWFLKVVVRLPESFINHINQLQLIVTLTKEALG